MIRIEKYILKNRINTIFDTLSFPPDLKVRYLYDDEICLLFIDSIVDINVCQETVIKPILSIPSDKLTISNMMDSITAMKIKMQNRESESKIPTALLGGSLIILKNNTELFLDIKVENFEKRTISTSDLEVTLRGPMEGFVESLSSNRSLIRSRLKTEKLKIITLNSGEYSNSAIDVYYIEGLADSSLVAQIQNKLKQMKKEYVVDSSFIEKYLDKRRLKLVPIIQNTQRPDSVVSSLMEGRIAIIVDGSPEVLILPAVFWQFIESPEDYYDLPIFAFFVKILRIIALFLSLTLPAIYVAVTSFHWGLIPTDLLISFASSRSTVPYPIIFEILVLEFTFEVLREAGLRFPKNVGQVVSIVGALVIGDAAVKAGLVSAPTVIVVAFTGIASFIVPKQNFGSSIRLIRFPLLLMSAIAGLPGLILSFSVLLVYFINIKSFGVNFMSPISKVHLKSIKRWWLSTNDSGDE